MRRNKTVALNVYAVKRNGTVCSIVVYQDGGGLMFSSVQNLPPRCKIKPMMKILNTRIRQHLAKRFTAQYSFDPAAFELARSAYDISFGDW